MLDIIKSNFYFFIIIFFIQSENESTFISLVRMALIGILIMIFLGRVKEVIFTKVTFSADGIRVYTGMFSKSERFVPREKFENTQTAATVLQRLFRAKTIIMETGDATGDVTLKFVKRADQEKIEAYLLEASDTTFITLQKEDDKIVLFKPTIRDLLKTTITSFSFLAIIPIGFNFWLDWKSEIAEFEVTKLPLWLTLLLIFLALIVVIGIAFLRMFNSYYKYEISMDDERIYVKKGWLTKQSLSIRKEKVQGVIYKQNWYQRLLRVTTIRLISTGEIMMTDKQEINEFFPYLPNAKADELVATMLPQFTRELMTHRASKKAKKLIWLRPPIFAVMIALVGIWQWKFYFVGAVVLLLTYVNRILAYKNLAFKLQEHHVQVKSGAFTVETLVTKRPKLIEIKFERSLLQRKTGVMSMKLTNRGKPIHVTELKDIDDELQTELIIWFEQRVKEVSIDPKSMDGALKKEMIVQLVTALKRKAQQLENR